MRLGRIGLALTYAACFGNAGHPTVTVASVPPPPPPPLPCIQIPDDAAAAIRSASADGQRLAFCVGAADDQCFAFDLATGKFDHVDKPPAPSPDPHARVAITNPDLQVCRGDACTSITPQVLPTTSKLRAATNTEGSFAVVLLGDAEHGKGYAEVWDVARGKKTATFPYARGEFRCGEVDMVGDTIYVSANTCAGPAARAALYTLKGKKIASVGGKEFGSYGNTHVQVAGPAWAFLAENGNQLVVQDVASGKLLQTIDTSGLWTPDGATSKTAMGNPGEHALVKLGDGKLAVIAGTPANGNIATIDPATGAVTIVRAPHCRPAEP
ncbi:MAG TPA: hypothetical protein VHN14_00725 [Kofleriaceae bacterium]|jgi:hypothetical protein|nr:hypothetical protein [Kofleriaceae bacterium]